jgi:hypothetical protein
MWCIPNITPEYIERMEDVLTLYAKPYDPKEPVLCSDEKSKQLLGETRPTQNTKAGKVKRNDYEYTRNGTRNLFVTIEPQGGHREVRVTKRRTKKDFAKEIKRVINLPRYQEAKKIHFVLDNLNTHFEKSFLETFGERETRGILSRIQFHYTPKHASWLNMAEIEIGILNRQCIRGRIPTEKALKRKVRVWSRERNKQKRTIEWSFTVKKAREKFKYCRSKLL